MKRINLLSMVTVLLIAVAGVGCTTVMGTDNGYPSERPMGDRVYVDDPYRGTVVLERDPYTGRYYEVGVYNSRYDNRVYRGYGTYGRNDGYYNRNRGWGYPSRGQQQQQEPRQPTQEEIRQKEENRSEARKRVLGN